MVNKKGDWSLTEIGMAILILVVLIVLISIFIGNVRQTEPFYSDTISSLEDQSCKVLGERMKLEGKLSEDGDIDLDNRPDYVCDICVCDKNQCPNGLTSNNDKDKNGNNIPEGCESGDVEDLWWEGCKKIQRQNAFKGEGDSGNIIILDKEKKKWQCRLKTYAELKSNTTKKDLTKI